MTIEPESQSVFTRESGGSITFQCRAYGAPLPSITWFRQNALLVPSGSKFQIDSRTDLDSDGVVSVVSSLTVSKLSPKDTGNYTCRAFNNISSASLPVPYVLTVIPVTIDYCSPNPCQNGGRCTSGLETFECECAEGFTGITCDTEATTPSPPVLTEQPQNIFVPLFSSASFSCVASGYPQPEIQWFKDGDPLLGETSRMLVFEEVSLLDRGFYHCTATNSEGFAGSLPVVLNIQGAYQFTVPVSLPLPIPTSGPFLAGEIPSHEVLTAISDLVDDLNNEATGFDVGASLVIYGIQTSGNATTVSSDE